MTAAKVANKLKLSELFRYITPVGMIIFLLLSGEFATKTEIREVQLSIMKINNSINLLLDWNKNNDKQDAAISKLNDTMQNMQIDMAKLNRE